MHTCECVCEIRVLCLPVSTVYATKHTEFACSCIFEEVKKDGCGKKIDGMCSTLYCRNSARHSGELLHGCSAMGFKE